MLKSSKSLPLSIRASVRLVLFSLAATVAVSFAVTGPLSGGVSQAAVPTLSPAPTFIDEFNGPAGSAIDGTKWLTQTGYGWAGGVEKQAYTPGTRNAWLNGDGALHIDARGEDYADRWVTDGKTASYTSARVMSKAAVTYGTISSRIKMTGSPGAHAAFWTLGANYPSVGWPFCGELDVMESPGELSNLYGSFHGPFAGQTVRTTKYNQGKMIVVPGGLAGAWHVYSATWTPTSVTFALDGTPYVSVNRSDLPPNQVWAMDNPQNLILNIAVGSEMSGTPARAANFHATMDVDWVRVDPLPDSSPPVSVPPGANAPAPTAPAIPVSPAKPRGAPADVPHTPKARVSVVSGKIVTSRGSRLLRTVLRTSASSRVIAVASAGRSKVTVFDRSIEAGVRTVTVGLPKRLSRARSVMVAVFSRSGPKALQVSRVRLRNR